MMPLGKRSLGPVAGMFSGTGAVDGVDFGLELGGVGCALFDGAGDFEVDGTGELLEEADGAGAGLFVFATSGVSLPPRCCSMYTPPITSATKTTPTTTKDTTDPPWFVRA